MCVSVYVNVLLCVCITVSAFVMCGCRNLKKILAT